MKINYLQKYVYEVAWKHHAVDIPMPTWAQIEGTIRELDPFHHPWCWLFIGAGHDDPTDNCMTVMGGDGIYWLALSAGKYDQLRLFNPEKSDREVDVWTSDQGFADHEFHTTTDIELVIRVVRHFAETGEPLPENIWEV